MRVRNQLDRCDWKARLLTY